MMPASSVTIECDECQQPVTIPMNGSEVLCACPRTTWRIMPALRRDRAILEKGTKEPPMRETN